MDVPNGTVKFWEPQARVVLQSLLQQLHGTTTERLDLVDQIAAKPATPKEVVPAEKQFGCYVCDTTFETHREMVSHFKSQAHLLAKQHVRTVNEATSPRPTDNANPRPASTKQPPNGTLTLTSQNSPKVSLRISIRSPEQPDLNAVINIRFWKVLLAGTVADPVTATQAAAVFSNLVSRRGKWTVLTLRDGYFAGAIFASDGTIICHKTFQR